MTDEQIKEHIRYAEQLISSIKAGLNKAKKGSLYEGNYLIEKTEKLNAEVHYISSASKVMLKFRFGEI